MQLENKTVFVTGANRGIGKAIVEALLTHDVKKIYAGARKIEDLAIFKDPRIVPIKLDITNRAQIEAAVALAADTDVLINNAGVLSPATIVAGGPDMLKYDMDVNYFGTLTMIRSFAPALAKKSEAAIANVISVVGLVSMPGIGGYSASKAALFSATQAMRAELKAQKIDVYGIFPGPIDTDMAKDFDAPKTSAATTAENILKGIIAGHEDIFPDPMSVEVGKLWGSDPKALERQFAQM